jgi:hypothetical protein
MWKAYLQDNFAVDGIDVYLVFEGRGVRQFLRRDGSIYQITQDNEGVRIDEPTFTLNQDAARALLDKLTQHFQGASDLHTVRGDLLHERGRVDRLLDTISQLASRPQELHVHKAEQ